MNQIINFYLAVLFGVFLAGAAIGAVCICIVQNYYDCKITHKRRLSYYKNKRVVSK